MIRVAAVAVVVVYMGPLTFQPFSWDQEAGVQAGQKTALPIPQAEATAAE